MLLGFGLHGDGPALYSGWFWCVFCLTDSVLCAPSFLDVPTWMGKLQCCLIRRARCFPRLIKAAGVSRGRGRKHVYLFFFGFNLRV